MHIDEWFPIYSAALKAVAKHWPEFLQVWDNKSAAEKLLTQDRASKEPRWQYAPDQAVTDILLDQLGSDHEHNMAYPVVMTMPREEWVNRFVAKARSLDSKAASGSEALQRAQWSLSPLMAGLIAKSPINPESVVQYIFDNQLHGQKLCFYVYGFDGERLS